MTTRRWWPGSVFAVPPLRVVPASLDASASAAERADGVNGPDGAGVAAAVGESGDADGASGAAAVRRWLRRRTLQETWLVLGVSLGASGIWSALSLVRSFLQSRQAHTSLSTQVSQLNASQSSLEWLDLIYQLVGIVLALVPASLALHLLGRDIRRPLRYLGIDGKRTGFDLAAGAGLAACIGIPGLGLYLAARSLGVNTTVMASGLGDHWWSIPVLVLAAAQNAVLEEVVMIGYLVTRWSQLGWGRWRVILTSAAIRGSYHLYQGLGGFVGNVIMGAILGWIYTKTRRILPLVIAHTILDVVSFVGYALLAGRVSWL